MWLPSTESVRECIAGGHCFYGVWSYFIFADISLYRVLRHMVADAFADDAILMALVGHIVPLETAADIRGHLSKRREGGSAARFLENVRHGNAFAEIEEAAVLASLFGVQIVIFSPHSDPVRLEPVTKTAAESAELRAKLPCVRDKRVILTAPPHPPGVLKVANAHIHYKAVLGGVPSAKARGFWQDQVPDTVPNSDVHYSVIESKEHPLEESKVRRCCCRRL
jgi:hypothetical protein